MDSSLTEDLRVLEVTLAGLAEEARALASGLGELEQWRKSPGSWNVPECLDHLAITNRIYLDAMRPAALAAEKAGRTRRGPAEPGLLGRMFVKAMEPPSRPYFKAKAPATVRPASGCTLTEALGRFELAHSEVRAFLDRYREVDLRGTRFPNPFVRGIHFSLATGLHVILAHEKRHLWQGWQVRRAAEAATSTS